jgi:hypothetical protein
VRPTLSEQLGGLRRILEVVVVPQVEDEYPKEILQAVIRAMAMLEERAVEALPFLLSDSQATAELLRAIAPHVPLSGPVESPDPPAPGDIVGTDAENDRLRVLLAEAIPTLAALPEADDVYQAVIAHLRDRMARYPYASTGTLPSR